VLLPLPELPQRFGELPKDREIIVHCKSGMRSAKAVQFLKEQGFKQVVNLQGGIAAWSEKVDPSVPKY
jgi:adenylyltransferase/sulfurtransferase